MIAQIDPSLVPPVYRDFLLDYETRYTILYGGRGSGKTKAAILKHVLRCYKNEYFKCVYVRKAAAHLRDSVYAALKTCISDLGLEWFFKCYDSDYRIIGANGNSFIPKGVDDPELTKGVDEVSHLLVEEATELDLEDFLTLDKLLRTNKTNVQCTLMFNPVMDTHWIRKHFFSPDDKHAPNPIFGERLKILRTTYKHNNFIDREAYYQTLYDGAAGDTNRIKVDIDGDWGMEHNDNPWLFNFNADKHVVDGSIPFRPTYPVILSFDFNRHPVSCLAIQHSPQQGMPDSFIDFIQEFTGDVQLEDLCKRILTTYPKSILFVTGDSTGKQGDIGFKDKHANYYKMIQAYLKLSDAQMKINSKNDLHSDSRVLCNTMLYHYPRIKMSKKNCPILVSDCSIAKPDDKSQDPHKLLKDRGDYKMDVFDCFRYFFQTFYKEYVDKVYLKNK